MDISDHEDPEDDRPSESPTPCGGISGKPRYRECLKNHAVTIGGHAVDGCGEFMPAGDEGTIDSLRCAACSCHRNFHRKELPASPSSALVLSSPRDHHHFHHPHLFGQLQHRRRQQYHRTPAGYLHQHGVLGGGGPHGFGYRPPQAATQAAPLALPSTSGGRDEEEMSGDPMEYPQLPGGGIGSSGPAGAEGSSGGTGSGRKRFRTKFTQEQKARMLEFAEKVGWRIQKHDEVAVAEFCNETGVMRHVLKVWMHNNKHSLGKKLLPPP